MSHPSQSDPGAAYRPMVRLWWTEGHRRIVPDGHPDSRFLFAIPGDLVPIEMAHRYGLVGVKESRPQENKEILPQATKKKKKR